jgi:hypothetical protein
MKNDLNNTQLLTVLVKAAYAKDEKTVESLWYEVLRRLDSSYYDEVTVHNLPLLVRI